MLKMLLDPMGGIVMTNDGYLCTYSEMPFLEKLMCSILQPKVSYSLQEFKMKKLEMELHL
jgi:hypothetical protein